MSVNKNLKFNKKVLTDIHTSGIIREGVREMDRKQIKETLEKQLQLLSERSEKSVEDRDLYQLTGAMVSLSTLLLAFD